MDKFQFLKSMMKELNLDESDLAKATGLSAKKIEDRLSGKVEWSLPEMEAIQQRYCPEIPISILFDMN